MEYWVPPEVPWARVKRLLLDRLFFAPTFLLLSSTSTMCPCSSGCSLPTWQLCSGMPTWPLWGSDV
ncbi:peroxisomal membrane protein 2, isoform CRA_d [Rattus norvegicus]|uniref:Peroxisomal membrane protein 2, isoform CRA_d n=1 Tax=Rattus norvegicus TaxID=10116 RepID=A6J2B9_RAT|nr:peroxisomal membrane protein 2, isoform CRA_d [Rattus norvegicus]